MKEVISNIVMNLCIYRPAYVSSCIMCPCTQKVPQYLWHVILILNPWIPTKLLRTHYVSRTAHPELSKRQGPCLAKCRGDHVPTLRAESWELSNAPGGCPDVARGHSFFRRWNPLGAAKNDYLKRRLLKRFFQRPFVWEDSGDPQNLGHWDSCTQRY